MMAHSREPWTIKRHGYESPYLAHEFILSDDGRYICGVNHHLGDEEQDANVSLLVNAPMWKALAQKLATIMVWRDSGKGPHESMSEFWAVWDAALTEAREAGLLEEKQ